MIIKEKREVVKMCCDLCDMYLDCDDAAVNSNDCCTQCMQFGDCSGEECMSGIVGDDMEYGEADYDSEDDYDNEDDYDDEDEDEDEDFDDYGYDEDDEDYDNTDDDDRYDDFEDRMKSF